MVSPCVIDTPRHGPAGEERSKRVQALAATYIIPRAGQPEEVAHAIVFCIQNDFVTGTTVDVDGGWLLS